MSTSHSSVDPRSLVCFALMAIWLTAAGAILFVLRIGPVVAVIDGGAGRGIHSGDVLAVPLVLLAMLLGVKGAALNEAAPRTASVARAPRGAVAA